MKLRSIVTGRGYHSLVWSAFVVMHSDRFWGHATVTADSGRFGAWK